MESKGICDISPWNIYDFFRENRDMKSGSTVAANVNTVLNYLDRAFPSETPELSGEVWVINLYLLVSDLMKEYVTKNREKDLSDFYLDFWKQIENVGRTGKGSPEEIRFADANSSGTTSKQNLTTRFEIMKKQFLSKHMDLELLDPKRLFDHFEKTVIYRRDKGICQMCGKDVPWEDYQADPIRAYVTGGPTTINNDKFCAQVATQRKAQASFQRMIATS